MPTRIDIIFDVPEHGAYFSPTLDAVSHAAAALGLSVDTRIVRTDTISERYVDDLPDAIVIGPGTPYANPAGAEWAIAQARIRQVPLVGT